MLYHLWQLVLGFNCGKTQTTSAGDESALDGPSRSLIFIGTWKTHPACGICVPAAGRSGSFIDRFIDRESTVDV